MTSFTPTNCQKSSATCLAKFGLKKAVISTKNSANSKNSCLKKNNFKPIYSKPKRESSFLKSKSRTGKLQNNFMKRESDNFSSKLNKLHHLTQKTKSIRKRFDLMKIPTNSLRMKSKPKLTNENHWKRKFSGWKNRSRLLRQKAGLEPEQRKRKWAQLCCHQVLKKSQAWQFSRMCFKSVTHWEIWSWRNAFYTWSNHRCWQSWTQSKMRHQRHQRHKWSEERQWKQCAA